MTKIAVIGANEFQDPLIRKAKEMGLETHVFSWEAGDVGEKSADFFHPISIVEKEEIWEVCRAVGVSACCSIGSDLATHTVNFIQRKLGMPCNPPITDTIATNKYDMRQALSAAGVPCPGFIKVTGLPSEQELAGMRYPMIVKPTDRSGSRGIYKVKNYAELCRAVPLSAACSFEHAAVIEEYIEGVEYSCEGISFAGEHRLLAFTKKFTTGAPHFIETGHREPADIPGELEGRLRESVIKALDALRIEYGASHTEFMITPEGEPRIIEIGARMGGDCIGSDLVFLSTGMDYTAMVIDCALGRRPDLTLKRRPSTAEIRFIFTADDLAAYEKQEAGRIWRSSVCAPEALSSEVTDSSNRHGWWITCGADGRRS